MGFNGSIALGYLLGSLTGVCAVDLPSDWWIASAIAMVGCIVVARGLRHRTCARRNTDSCWVGLSLATVWLLGFAQTSWIIDDWLATRVASQDDGARWIVEGEVVSVPALRANSATFDAVVRIVAPRSRASEASRRMRIRWPDANALPAVGERWRWLVEVRARPTAAFVVDVERHWLRDRVHGAARVLRSASNQRIDVARPSIDKVRERIAFELGRHVVDRDALALIRALSVGLTDQMTREQWRVFAATGTTHLVAISGMHVTLFAWMAFALARALWRHMPTVADRLDREPFALATGLAAATMYGALAGMSVPTQRTLLMLGSFALLRLAARVMPRCHTLSIALLLVLILDPLAPLGAGFWLSFVAVAAIVWVAGARLRPTSAAQTAIEVQFVVMLALTPLTLASFGTVSLASLITNAAAIPIISFVLVPLVLLGALTTLVAPTLAALTLALAEAVYRVCWPLLSAAADWPYATLVAQPQPVWYAVGALGAWLSITAIDWKLRMSGVLALLPLMFSPVPVVPSGHARIELFDTGRGVLALIATARHSLVYDTGDSFGTDGAHIANIVQPWLARWRRVRIDAWILPRVTHDRAAGVGRLVASTSVQSVRGGGPWRGSLVPYRPCEDGERWILDQVVVEQWLGRDGSKAICGIRLRVGRHSLLLAGEFNRAAERDWLVRAAQREFAVPTWAVLVPRRGAATASSAEWIGALRPQVAIVTGIPTIGPAATQARTIVRWEAAGARVYQTTHSDRLEIAIEPESAAIARRKTASAYPFLWKSDP